MATTTAEAAQSRPTPAAPMSVPKPTHPQQQNGQHSAPAPDPSPFAKNDAETRRERLRMMMLIRRFEERTYQEYTKPGQKIGGFCHLYSGQEAISVAIAAIFHKGVDALINAYRCHGHSLALGMPPRAAMAELFGKRTGCAKGKGGSMHFFDAEVGNHGGHGIVGGHLPVASGLAFAQWYQRTGGVTFCLFGDGAINQGTHNEALNLSSLWKLPNIWLIENNGVAMGTQVARHSAEQDLAKRGLGYNMPTYNVDGNDLDGLIKALGEAKQRGRAGDGPTYFSVNTFRFRGHSMSDPLKYRPKEMQDAAKLRDPITLYEAALRKDGQLDDGQYDAMAGEVRDLVEDAIAHANEAPHPALEERFEDVLAETYPYGG